MPALALQSNKDFRAGAAAYLAGRTEHSAPDFDEMHRRRAWVAGWRNARATEEALDGAMERK